MNKLMMTGAILLLTASLAMPAFSQEAETETTEAVNVTSITTDEVSDEVGVEVVAETEGETENYVNLDVLLAGSTKSLDALSEDIQALVFDMDYLEREELYKKNLTKVGLPIFLNWIPGFGTGSKKQGDTLSKNISLGVDIGVTTLLVSGGVVLSIGLLVDVFVVLFTAGHGDMDAMKGLTDTGLGLMIGAVALWGANRIFGTVMPIVYAKQRNAKLKTVLGLDEKVEEVSLVPVINPVQEKYGLALALKF